MKASPRTLVVLSLVLAQLVGCAAAPAPPPLPAAPPAPVTAANGTVVQVQPAAQPCCPHPTIWEVLGFKVLCKGFQGLFGRLLSKLGMVFPGLEPKPALLPITDPANMASDNPAIAAAAGVKADEDSAQQKIKAIRYLGTIGCGGCYPDVQDALLAALDDCTEEVRYEAVKALREQSGHPCSKCKATACCSEKVRKRLDKVANEKDAQNCYKESSSRVRRLARLTLAGCGTAVAATTPTTPLEGPTAAKSTTVRVAQAIKAERARAGIVEPEPTDMADDASEETELDDEPQEPSPSRSVRKASTTRKASAQVIVPAPAPVRPPCDCESPHAANEPCPLHSHSHAERVTLAGGAIAAEAGQVKTLGTVEIPTPGEFPVQTAQGSRPLDDYKPATAAPLGAVLAKVNGESVYESEVQQVVARLPEARSQLTAAIWQRALQLVIDRKLICQEARRRVGKSDVALAAFTGSAPASNAPSTLLGDEEQIAANWLQRRVVVDETCTLGELQAYYQSHRESYVLADQARGEIMTARIDRFDSQQRALATIEYLRNQALGVQSAAPPAEDLRKIEVLTPAWRERNHESGSRIEHALFTQPTGTLSPILEEDAAYHVVHVLEQRHGQFAQFEAVADRVRREVVAARRQRAEHEYLENLRVEALVFQTARWDSNAAGSTGGAHR